MGEQKVQTRLDTPREGDAILSHGPTLWIIPPISTALSLENPFPSDSTRSGTRDKHQQVLPRFGFFGLKQREKNILWEMPPQFQMKTTGNNRRAARGKSPWGWHCPGTAQGRGLSPAAEKGVKWH